MAINFNQPKSLSIYNTEDIKNHFDNNNISVFLDSAFERGRINKNEYAFLLDFLSTHDPHNLTTQDIYNLENNQIYTIQKYFDEYNVAYIEAAYKQQLINKEEFKSLYKIYNDGMTYYKQVYKLFLKLFHKPQSINGFDAKLGNILLDKAGNPINYEDIRVITPFVKSQLEFIDENVNSICVILPKIKSAHRTIDKLLKEIGKNINKEISSALDKYLDCEDRERFEEICEKPLKKAKNKTIELHDIARLSVTRKYLSGINHITNIIKENAKENNYKIDTPRNRFDAPLYENGKLYFDSKIIITLQDNDNEPYDVELELKIDTLCHADNRTHENYDKYRQLIESISENDPNKETKLARADELEQQNRQINKNAIHEYNMIIFDKIQRDIDTFYEYLNTPNSDGSYTECNEFISDNYLVGSYEAFDPKTAFDPNHYTNGKPINKMCFLKLVGMLPKHFDEFAPGADKLIEEKFNSIYDKSAPERYQEFHPIRSRFRDILATAEKYSDKINEKIIDKIVNDFSEAHASLVTDTKSIENFIRDKNISADDNIKIEIHTKKYLSSISDQSQKFDPETFTGKLCILKLLRRLPKDFPETIKELNGTKAKVAEQIYTNIFNNPTDKDHALLSRLLKVAINKKDDIQNKLGEKIKNKTSQKIKENAEIDTSTKAQTPLQNNNYTR